MEQDSYTKHPCPRCGIIRIARRGGTLCGDCRYVLGRTPEMLAAWIDTPSQETVGSEP